MDSKARLLCLCGALALPSTVFAAVQGALTFSDPAMERSYCSLPGDASDSVSAAAFVDLDGDGLKEAAFGAINRPYQNNTEAGAVYLIPGGIPVMETETLITDLLCETWIEDQDYAHGGMPLLAVPDQDGDGLDELGAGSPDRDSGSTVDGGVFYLIYGGFTPIDGDLHDVFSDADILFKSTSDGTDDDDTLGSSVSTGDVDGDGIGDVAIGVPGFDGYLGATYVVLGGVDTWIRPWDPDLVPPSIALYGVEADWRFGRDVEIIPDLDGDGFDELFVAEWTGPNATTALSRSYLYYGRPAAEWAKVTMADWDASFIQDAATSSNPNDVEATNAGDLDGDGYDEFALSSGYAWVSALSSDAGSVYLIWGTGSRLAGPYMIDIANTAMARINASDDNGTFGASLVALGDYDGDGLDDLAVGAPTYGSTDDGRAYVFTGSATRLRPVNIADRTASFFVDGTTDEELASDLLAEDVDLDGYTDLVIVSPGYLGPDGADSGRALVVYGGPIANLDMDGDGYVVGGRCTVQPHDCDDTEATAYPGAVEIWYSGIDEDCDGGDDFDQDYDGYLDPLGGGLDCNDLDPSVNPGAPEGTAKTPKSPLVGDGIDNDCDGLVDEGTTYYDDDGDWWSEAQGDCDDADAAIYPGAEENGDRPYGVGDGIDNNCDGQVDEDLADWDLDSDGFSQVAGGDCDDQDADVNPGVKEILNDGIDNDCDGLAQDDLDGDGHLSLESGGDDCVDTDPLVFPGATEIPDDKLDSDCDGDSDGDTVLDGKDCEPYDAAIYPDAPEDGGTGTNAGNGLDDDCDGTTDEGTLDFDDDADGFTETAGDCDDSNAAIYPDAPENGDQSENLGDGLDNNCDGTIDEGTESFDDDGDGYSEEGGDCDDTDPEINPGASDLTNGIDDNCDGFVDETKVDEKKCGCATQSGGTTGWWLALAGLLVARRRIRRA